MQVGKLGLPVITINEFPRSVDQFDTRVFLAFYDLVKSTEIGRGVLERLTSDPRSAHVSEKMVSCGTGATRVELQRLAAWWLWRANDVGIERADSELNAFLDADEIEVQGVVWTYAIEPTETIRLRDGISVVPLTEMPPSADKEDFLTLRFRFQNASVAIPSAALVKTYVTPKISSEVPGGYHPGFEVQSELHEAALLLNCLAGICCAAAYSTSYSPPSVPLGPFGGRGGGSPIYDVIPRVSTRLEPGSEETFSKLVEGFRGLKAGERTRVESAIRRIMQAKGRLNEGDKVLDLGIALEMLLLHQEHGKQELPGQLTLHFRLRGAWLLGSSAEERRSLFRALGKIYSLRSQMAHNGSSDELTRMSYGDRRKMIEDHISVGERLTQRLVISGFPDDWSSLILGGVQR